MSAGYLLGSAPARDDRWRRLGRDVDLLRLMTIARLHTWTRRRWLGYVWWLCEPLALTGAWLIMLRQAWGQQHAHLPLFLLCATLPWAWFYQSTLAAAGALSRSATVLKNIAAPFTLFPTSEVLAATVRFSAIAPLLALVVAFMGEGLSVRQLWIAPVAATQLMLMLGIGQWLAMAQVCAADVTPAWQVVARVWFFLSPTLYHRHQLPESLDQVMRYNPWTPLLEGYRYALIGESPAPGWGLAWVFLGSALLWVGGYFAMRRWQGALALRF